MAQIYEVTVVFTGDDAPEFESYMADKHIPDVLATGCFAAAFFAKEGNRYTVGYHVDSPDDMRHYLDEFAPKLRDDVMERYEGRIQISRRMLDIVKLFGGG
jgi:hypothetical protein